MLHCCIVHYTPLQNNLHPLIRAVVNKEIIKDCRALTYRVQMEANLQGDYPEVTAQREEGSPGNSWWGVPLPGSPNPDPITDQKMSLPHPFSDLVSKKLCHHYLD